MDSEQTAVATHSVKDKIFQRVPYAVGALIGLYFLLGAIGLGVGTLSAPAPGLWPSIVAVVLIGCCVLGMLIGGIGFVFLILTVLGERNLKHHARHAAIAVVTIGVMWALFTFGLNVILPEGEILRVW